ncbi:MAG TPA: MucR family transcriptional regulator [Sphingopyxis sp.]|nr:MucR family transcriptional regulator [Sphingopyxis sp.]
MTETPQHDSDLLTLTADIVAAHVGNNSVAISDISILISNVHAALSGLSQPAEVPEEKPVPAVSIRSSVKPDYIVCLEDGKKLKMLRRHLMTHYGLTPDDYRSKWGLPADYPMVAPDYAERRRVLAKEIGLGTKGRGGGRKPARAAAKPAAKRT